MKILFGSIVRDGESYLERYFRQLSNLKDTYDITLAITEGDSKDNSYYKTLELSEKYGVSTLLFKYDLKGTKFRSVNHPERWMNIAKTWNYMLDQIQDTLKEYDCFCYMEADLIWSKGTINTLVEDLEIASAVAPMSMLGTIFYDTWGHRAYNENFSNIYPYHSLYNSFPRYMPLQSAGSCILMDSKVAQKCRLSEIDAMIGHDIVKNNYTFVLDKLAVVNHP